MRISDCKALVGKIVVLDMVTGARLTTKIKEVVEEDGQHFLHCDALLVFALQVVGMEPGKGPKIELRDVFPYSIPELAPAKDNFVDVTHVILAGPAQPQIADLYAKQTGSILPAAAGTPLPDLDKLGAAMSKLTAKP